MGCNGGYMTAAYAYLKKYEIMNKTDYPYVGVKQATCKYIEGKGVVNASNYVNVSPYNATNMMKAVA
jgi:hypothetical protein